jgi:sterol 14-demethylase
MLEILPIADVFIVLFTALAVIMISTYISSSRRRKGQLPHVPYLVPYVGSIVGFGTNPVQFIRNNYEKYGEVFSAKILGKNMTFIAHPKAYDTFFKPKDTELEQREVYKFMKPVFGSGVVYDAESPDVMMEQLKFVTSGLTTARFINFVKVFDDEVKRKVSQLGDSGVMDIFQHLSDLIIFTASRCLLGDDIRRFLETKNLGQLYHDLDEGISPLSFFYPSLPQSKRDRARKKIGEIFKELIEIRKKQPEKRYDDVLDTLLHSEYKSGTPIPDDHIVGILIAGLFAGQHTSSIASTWTLLNIVNDRKIYERVIAEQKLIMGRMDAELEYDKVQEMLFLERCMQESLRMYPPLIMLMRYVKKTLKYNDMRIPKGNILVISTSMGGSCAEVFENPHVFDPDRFAEPRSEHLKVRHAYLAFGSGRHKCIGENFAMLQVKSILSGLFRHYDLELIGELPKVSHSSLVVGPTPPCLIKYTRRKD